MKLAVEFPSVAFREGPEKIIELAKAVEEIGYDELAVFDTDEAIQLLRRTGAMKRLTLRESTTTQTQLLWSRSRRRVPRCPSGSADMARRPFGVPASSVTAGWTNSVSCTVACEQLSANVRRALRRALRLLFWPNHRERLLDNRVVVIAEAPDWTHRGNINHAIDDAFVRYVHMGHPTDDHGVRRRLR